jgi:hypothetical protein
MRGSQAPSVGGHALEEVLGGIAGIVRDAGRACYDTIGAAMPRAGRA